MTFDEIRNVASGFQPAQLLLAALKVGLFDLLAGGPKDATSIASELRLDTRATGLVANALAAMGLLQLEPEGFRNTEAVRRYLVRGSPEYRGEILLHLYATWEDWSGLAETWRTGRALLRRMARQLPSSEEGLRHFILGMENITRELAPMLAEQLPLAGCRTILDLGGGPGNYALAFALRWPDLRIVHLDLPPTSRIAREFVGGKQGAERISFLEGDFLTAPLGGPYDFVWASQIIHMLSEAQVRGLLGRVAGALAPGGCLAVHDQFLEPDKTAPRSAAVFGVHMLVATEGGRTYSFEELEAWLCDAELTPRGRLDYGGPSRVLLGSKSNRPPQ